MTKEQLDKEFRAAYEKASATTQALPQDIQLLLYAYYKQGNHKSKIIPIENIKENDLRSAFKYNALGKPVEIQMEKVGTINVSYNNFGEIKKVESKQGHKMALQVTQAFQNLLAIVKPAGVNLNM